MSDKQRILITGGNGAVGKEVVRRLAASGHQLTVVGRTRDVEIPGVSYAPCDILDFPSLRQAVRGMQAVIHLAAIPNPSAGSSEQVFQINAQGTYNVFRACEEEGIRRVVQASSINALGVHYGRKETPVHYLPVDEDHPCVSTDAYSFSKHVIEDIGDYFWRRSGVSSVALRLPWVTPASHHEIIPGRKAMARELCDRLFQLSPGERREWYDRISQAYNRQRAAGVLENRVAFEEMRAANPNWLDDSWFAMTNRNNFFTQLDERDSAQSVEKSLLADYEGSHVLFINDDHNWTGIPSRTLAELFYPEVTTFKKDLIGTETLVSIDRARRLIGFEVEYSFDN